MTAPERLGRFCFGRDTVKRRFLLIFTALLVLPLAAARQNRDEPLVMLELPAEAVAYHLGLKSWNFVYNFFTDEHIYVKLVYYEREQAGDLVRTELTGGYGAEGDPLGRQRITLVLGPNGTSIPVSMRVNQSSFLTEITEDINLDSFNVGTSTEPGATLPPTGQPGAFILLSNYPSVNSQVTATGNPDDMDAYLALEIEFGTP